MILQTLQRDAIAGNQFQDGLTHEREINIQFREGPVEIKDNGFQRKPFCYQLKPLLLDFKRS